MSHYFAQEMFSKVLVSPTLPPPYNTLKVSIVSDHLEPLEVELMVKIQRWDELENHFYVEFLTAQVQEQSVYQVDIDMLKLLQKGRCFESNSTIPRFDYCFLTFQ